MKLLIPILFFFSLPLLAQPCDCKCTDRYEQNDSYLSARKINIPGKISANIKPPGDEDWFWFNVTSPTLIFLLADTSKDYIFDVVCSNGFQVTVTHQVLHFYPTPPLRCRVRVYSQSGLQTANRCYSLIIDYP